LFGLSTKEHGEYKHSITCVNHRQSKVFYIVDDLIQIIKKLSPIMANNLQPRNLKSRLPSQATLFKSKTRKTGQRNMFPTETKITAVTQWSDPLETRFGAMQYRIHKGAFQTCLAGQFGDFISVPMPTDFMPEQLLLCGGMCHIWHGDTCLADLETVPGAKDLGVEWLLQHFAEPHYEGPTVEFFFFGFGDRFADPIGHHDGVGPVIEGKLLQAEPITHSVFSDRLTRVLDHFGLRRRSN